MTSYRHTWLELIQARDTFYLLILIAVLLAYGWYRFMFKRLFKLAVAGAGLMVGLGLLWGLWQLLLKG